MIDINEIEKRFIMFEGLKLSPYICPAGYLTIGVGRNLEANPINNLEIKVVGDWKRGLTKNAALFLLRNDIFKAERECRKHFPFWKQLDDERQYALLDMCFNLGINSLLKFKKMLGAMEIGDYQGAAKECLNSKYAKDTGKRAKKIARTIETGEFKYD